MSEKLKEDIIAEADSRPERNQEVVAKGKTVKPRLITRMANIIIGEHGIQAAAEYVRDEVVIPTLKDAVGESFHAFVDAMLYGRDDVRPRKKSSGYHGNNHQSRASTYHGRHKGDSTKGYGSRPRDERHTRNSREVNIKYFDTRNEAVDVLRRLHEYVDDYGYARVGDYYDAVGEYCTPGDWDFGWRDIHLEATEVSRHNRKGYYLDLPAPSYINRRS